MNNDGSFDRPRCECHECTQARRSPQTVTPVQAYVPPGMSEANDVGGIQDQRSSCHTIGCYIMYPHTHHSNTMLGNY